MGHGTDDHLEHAQHVQHHAADPFDRRVALSMAIIAAVLAGATMVSHRGHTETVRLTAEASIAKTAANDQWSFYQAKNIRSHEYQALLLQMAYLPQREGAAEDQKRAFLYWYDQVYKYEGPDIHKGPFGELLAKLAKINNVDLDERKKKIDARRKKEEEKKHGELPVMIGAAREHEKKAERYQEQGHHIHHAVDFVDFGHLGMEIALVLCSVAVLTKNKTFWLSGLAAAVIGLGLAGFGIYEMNVDPTAHASHPAESGKHH